MARFGSVGKQPQEDASERQRRGVLWGDHLDWASRSGAKLVTGRLTAAATVRSHRH